MFRQTFKKMTRRSLQNYQYSTKRNCNEIKTNKACFVAKWAISASEKKLLYWLDAPVWAMTVGRSTLAMMMPTLFSPDLERKIQSEQLTMTGFFNNQSENTREVINLRKNVTLRRLIKK